MPPKNRKRRNEEITSDQDDGGNGAAQAEDQPRKRPKKMTKAEKEAAKQRARLAMMDPKKNAAPAPAAAASPAPAPARPPAPPVAAAAAATSPPAGKLTKQQLKARAKAAMTRTETVASPPVPAAAPAPTTTTRRKTPAAPRTTAARKAAARTNAAREEPNTVGMPPTSYNTPAAAPKPVEDATATGQETNEHTGEFTFNAGVNNNTGGEQFHSPQAQQQPATDLENEAMAGNSDGYTETDNNNNNEPEEDTLVERLNKFCSGNLFLFAILPATIVLFWLYASGSFVYNQNSGMFMVVGTTRIPFESQQHFVANKDETKNVLKSTKICYHDSPEDVLELVDEENLSDAYVSPNDCATTLPCPHNAICFQGYLVDCQKPVWQLSERNNTSTTEDTTPICVLSKAVNQTYNNLVNLLETWTISHMCLTTVDGVTPLAFYEQDKSDPTALVVSQGDKISSGVPLYTWSVLYKEGPEDLEEIIMDYEVLKTINQFHQKLALDDNSGPPAVGLSKNQYRLVEKTKLPGPCKTSRSILAFLTALGEFCWGITRAMLDCALYLVRAAPIPTTIFILVVALLAHIRHFMATKKRRQEAVLEVRTMALNRLQTALRKTPGKGMHAGEVAVIHLRDELAEALYGAQDSGPRREFLMYIWPEVVRGICRDNRVRKETRPVVGTKRELWTWVAAADEDVKDD